MAMKKSRIWIVSSAPSPILASLPAAFSKIKDFWRIDAVGREAGEFIKWGTSCWRNWVGGRAERENVSSTNERMWVGLVEGSVSKDNDDSIIPIGTVPANESIKATVSGLPSRWAPCSKVTALLKSPSHLFIKASRTTPPASIFPNLTPSSPHIRINLSTPATGSTGPNRNLAQRLVRGSIIRLT